MELAPLVSLAVEQGASDLHLQERATPMIRIGGLMQPAERNSVTHEELMAFLKSIWGRGDPAGAGADGIAAAIRSGLDFSWDLSEAARFRCSAYQARGRLSLVMRVIRTKIPSISDLHLPSVVFDI